jgi:hypothetical protein
MKPVVKSNDENVGHGVDHRNFHVGRNIEGVGQEINEGKGDAGDREDHGDHVEPRGIRKGEKEGRTVGGEGGEKEEEKRTYTGMSWWSSCWSSSQSAVNVEKIIPCSMHHVELEGRRRENIDKAKRREKRTYTGMSWWSCLLAIFAMIKSAVNVEKIIPFSMNRS